MNRTRELVSSTKGVESKSRKTPPLSLEGNVVALSNWSIKDHTYQRGPKNINIR